MKTTKENNVHKNLGFSYLETAEIVVKLNMLLANYQMHFHRLQNFTWNIKGKDFFTLHEKFNSMYLATFNNINKVAERIRVFNQVPLSQIHEAKSLSEIELSSSELTSLQMVNKLRDDQQLLLSFVIETHEMASKNGDVGTADLMNSIIRQIEKDYWMLSAWTVSEEVAPEPQMH